MCFLNNFVAAVRSPVLYMLYKVATRSLTKQKYITTKHSDPFWKAFLMYFYCSVPNTLTTCAIVRSAAENLG